MAHRVDLGILDQIGLAWRPTNRAAFAIGIILGAFVPSATYVIAHFEAPDVPLKWVLVAGGLIYSALTVVQWGRTAFASLWKSIGFVILLEGVTVTATTVPLSLAALFILASINGLSTGYRLIIDRRDARRNAAALTQRSMKGSTSASKPKRTSARISRPARTPLPAPIAAQLAPART